jgi:hypothetical protein
MGKGEEIPKTNPAETEGTQMIMQTPIDKQAK